MTPREIVQQLESLEPGLEAAFMDEIRASLDAVTLAEVERLVEQGQSDGVADAIKFGGFILFLERLRSAYMQAGKLESQSIRIRVVKLQLDPAGQRVESWFRELAREVRADADQQKRQAVAATITAGRQAQRTSRQITLDIVGRIDKSTGRRSGGTAALAWDQAETVARARTQLESGDPEQMKKYLTRVRRDRRFDPIVKRAIEAGKPVAKADVDRIAGRYADRLLVTRATTAAKARALEAVNAARDELHRQMIDRGLDAAAVSKTWRTRGDLAVRHTHAILNGVRVGFNDLFATGSGALMRFPGDTSFSAPLNEIMGCRCSVQYRIRIG